MVNPKFQGNEASLTPVLRLVISEDEVDQIVTIVWQPLEVVVG